jgi:hypothetical protein
MQTLHDALVIIVGKNGEVSMPNPNSILIKHSFDHETQKWKHWFRIYPDARPNSDSVFLLDSQGGIQAIAQPKSIVVEFMIKLFRNN